MKALAIAPCRSRCMSSMLSAPAIIPNTRHSSLATGNAPAEFTDDFHFTSPAASTGSPHRSASRTTGTSPP